MEDERLEEYRRQARLREQEEEERRKRMAAADLRLQQQERQAQDKAPPTMEQHYAQLPRHFYTGIR